MDRIHRIDGIIRIPKVKSSPGGGRVYRKIKTPRTVSIDRVQGEGDDPIRKTGTELAKLT